MVVVNERTIDTYGKSADGKWYASWFYNKDGEYDGWHGEGGRTLSELCAKLKVSRTALRRDCARIDLS